MFANIPAKVYLYAAWLQALAATIGSLYFSEIAGFPPCTLCWYQRILTYPLVLMLPIAINLKDKIIHWYVLPLAFIGFLISIYHNFLYWGILPESKATCQLGISCTTKYVEFFGFVTIPLLSTIAYLVIIGSMIGYARAVQTAKK